MSSPRGVRQRPAAASALGALVLACALVASAVVGTDALGTGDALGALLRPDVASRVAVTIVWQLRLPRALGGVVCGAALAVSGLLLQAVLDNRLAAPSVMGINAGAGLAVLVCGLALPFVPLARQLSALAGALVATLAVMLVARRAGVSRTTLVLAGVAVASLFSAGSDALVTARPDLVADRVAFQLGGLAGVSWQQLQVAAAITLVGIVAAYALGPGVDLLALGDQAAFGLGLDARLHRAYAVVIAAALASAAVSVAGLVGFVGLIVPNLVRMVARGGFREEAVACAIWGACLLVGCDLVGRLVLYPYELPVGLVLSLLGAPFFLAMLMRGRGGMRR